MLTVLILFQMARFNRVWPNKMIKCVKRTRLESFVRSKDVHVDKELELWDNYLSHRTFAARQRFRIFGYSVNYRWFTTSFVIQLGLPLFSLVKSNSSKGMFASYLNQIDQAMC